MKFTLNKNETQTIKKTIRTTTDLNKLMAVTVELTRDFPSLLSRHPSWWNRIRFHFYSHSNYDNGFIFSVHFICSMNNLWGKITNNTFYMASPTIYFERSNFPLRLNLSQHKHYVFYVKYYTDWNFRFWVLFFFQRRKKWKTYKFRRI